MDLARWRQIGAFAWQVDPVGAMRVPAILYASAALAADMEEKVYDQLTNVAKLPGIVDAAYAMPDAHWGYGFPIGGVAAFDPDLGGVVSAGGVGFDISCGVRTLTTGLAPADLAPVKQALADALFRRIPAGVGATGRIRLSDGEMDAMLAGGARCAVDRGWGVSADLARIEDGGTSAGARPDFVSAKAKARQRDEMGTLGSGNHYLEIQEVAEIYDPATARAFGLAPHAIVVTIHCGSRSPTASSLARRSSRASASATSARCEPGSTARSPTARSSPTWCVRCSPRSCRAPGRIALARPTPTASSPSEEA